MQPTIVRKIGTRVAEESYFLRDILLRQFFFQIQLFAVVHCAFDSFWRKMDPFLSINFLLTIIYTFIIFCCWEKTLIVSKLARFSLFSPGSPTLKQILYHIGEGCLWDPQFEKDYKNCQSKKHLKDTIFGVCWKGYLFLS